MSGRPNLESKVDMLQTPLQNGEIFQARRSAGALRSNASDEGRGTGNSRLKARLPDLTAPETSVLQAAGVGGEAVDEAPALAGQDRFEDR